VSKLGRPQLVWLLLLAALAACAPRDRPLTLIGTADLHGYLESHDGAGGLALLGGYLANLRRVRPVVLVDAGDLFQGTLISNQSEGAPVIRAMNALGYHGAAIGNHEFDYGPVGEPAVARRSGEDPRGALRARAREAAFPFLAANILAEPELSPPAWEHVVAATLVEVGGVRVGITGGTTPSTPTVTNPLNVRDLRFEPLAPRIAAQAAELRRRGAQVVIATVHAGGHCSDFRDPDDLSSCEGESEVFRLARALPPGAVDAIVAGHTHRAIAHRVAGIPIIQSWSGGKGFGRVDLLVEGRSHRVQVTRIYPPQVVKEGELYEGQKVVADAAVARTWAADAARAESLRKRPLGVEVKEPLWRGFESETPLGNLVADLLREAVPGADFGLQNAGGLRSDLPAGPLTYGRLYELLPFDNKLAVVTVRGETLSRLLVDNYTHRKTGFLSVSGLGGRARCVAGGGVQLELERTGDHHPLGADEKYRVVTSDFIALGGDAFRTVLADPQTHVDVLWDRPTIHDVTAELLMHRGGRIGAADLFDRAHPRIELPAQRPICVTRE
jgi:5'-nucleotidase